MLILGRISLACRSCLQKNIFSNPHACNKVFVLMMIVRNKRIGYLTTTPSPGHPNWPRTNHWTPPPQSSHLLLVRQIWFPPQIGHTLDHWWITWWSRESALSSRARVTSLYSHREVHLPSARDIHLDQTCRQITRQRRHVHTQDLYHLFIYIICNLLWFISTQPIKFFCHLLKKIGAALKICI